MSLPFQEKVVIVTGGNSGIGAAATAIFAAQGANVVCLDIAASASNPSDSVHYIQCDVSSDTAVATAVDSVINRFGHIDILVNNAGIMDDFSKIGDTSNESWSKVLGINLNGPFHLMRACLPHMLKNDPKPAPDAPPTFSRKGEPGPPRAPSKGVIVNVGSAASAHGGTAGAAYTTSKHALLGLSRNTAWMYRDQGIRCNVVLPGGVATNIHKNSAVTLNQEGFAAVMPYQGCMFSSIAMPDAVANAIVWLAGSGAASVNGAEIAVDDGWTVV